MIRSHLLGLAAIPAALALILPAATWSSDAPMAQHSFGSYVVRNNMWNDQNGAVGHELVWANSEHDWGIHVTMPAGNTAIESYPDVQQTVYQPASSLSSLYFTYTEAQPSDTAPDPGGDYEAAADVWLNNWATEVMVWVDTNHQRPAGQIVATAVISGVTFDVWQAGSGVSGLYSFVTRAPMTSGTVHVLSTVNWLVSHGKIPANPSVQDTEFGWEIASTGGAEEDGFHVSSYALHVTTR